MLLFDLLYLIFLLVSLPLWVKFLVKKEYRALLKHRLSPNIEYSAQKRIWIHAVSVGEVRSLRCLIDQLKEKYKEKEIVLSVTTPAGYECAKKEYPDIAVINAPLDFSFTIKKFIRQINPQLLILNELEIWPNWVSLTRRKKIPQLLINGRVSDLAFKRYKRSLFLVKPFFKRIDRFLVQAELYKERFKQLHIPAEKITVCGNIKAEEASTAIENLAPAAEIWDFLGTRPNDGKVITLASSHRSDEEFVFPILPRLEKNALFIIVPRHLTRIEEIETLLKKYNVTYSVWSKTRAAGSPPVHTGSGTTQTIIFDKMGYLFNILKISDIVFMGGTLEQKIGGHNLYEPAVLGKFIIGGRFYNNFPDIGRELVAKGAYKIVNTPEECLDTLNQWKTGTNTPGNIGNPGFPGNPASAAIQAVSQRKGSIQCILKEIHRFIA